MLSKTAAFHWRHDASLIIMLLSSCSLKYFDEVFMGTWMNGREEKLESHKEEMSMMLLHTES